MASSEGAPLDWTPNTLVEQRVHHNTNKAQQTGRQIHPPLWHKEGNLQPHSPWMVHFILEDHSANCKGTKVRFTNNLPLTHLEYTVPTSNAFVTYAAAQKSTYRLRPDAEGTAYTVYTWAQYNDLPGPKLHQNRTWHQPLHGNHVSTQDEAKATGNTAPAGTTPTNIINWILANARMPLIHTGCPTPDNATHRRSLGPIRPALHHDIDRD